MTFTSGTLQLTIDTARWWADEAYYTSWHERVVACEEVVTGLHIAVRCSEKMTQAVRQALEPVDHDQYRSRKWSSFQGYNDVFQSVTCNGVPVRTTPPAAIVPKHVLVQTTYMGQELVIGGNWDESQEFGYFFDGARGRATCNWYGQLVPMPELGAWVYYLKVRDGRPINPKSPSRQGVIDDAALQAFLAFVCDTIFATLADPAHRERVTPMALHAAYLLDSCRAGELPYLLVAPYVYDGNGSNLVELGGLGGYEVVTYAQAPLLLSDEIALDRSVMDAADEPIAPPCNPDAPQTYRAFVAQAEAADGDTPSVADDTDDATNEPDIQEYGLASFVPVLRAAGTVPYKLIAGNAERLTIHLLYWQPGKARADEFNELGQYGCGTYEAAPTAWHAVTGVTSVFCFADASSYDATEIHWNVGTTDPLDFLSKEVWFGFCPNDDEDQDPQEDQFRDTVNAWKRRLIGDCVPRTFAFFDVQRLMPTKASPIVSIKYVLPRKKRGVARDQDTRLPTAIIARHAVGERKQFTLYA